MSELHRVLAVDLGASSGRVIVGTFDGERIVTEELHRFSNTPQHIGAALHWDAMGLLQEIKEGIRLASRKYGELLSLSVDTWGVDYGVIDKAGNLRYPPYHYRDQRMLQYRSKLEELLPPEEQFRLTGNQPDPINTVYQLFADVQLDPELQESSSRILMMPDLFHYLLSGIAAGERTILSTSGLMSAGSGELAPQVFSRLGISPSLIADITAPGTVLGTLRPELCEELNCGSMKIIAGASHDTASAVASIPYVNKESAAFISCGTWSLVGLETEKPILTEQCYRYGFTNESCAGGSNRLLKNITGLWLLQETQRAWAETGTALSFGEMVRLAENEQAAQALINPGDPLFSTPGDIPGRIADYCRSTRQLVPDSKGAVVRLILESLAEAYRLAIIQLEELTGATIGTVHMVGGGIQNRLLCQLTADATGKKVIAGPVEASAIGNVIVQLAALGLLDYSRAGEVAAASGSLAVYRPAQGKHH